mgnify:CR=1 FL=1
MSHPLPLKSASPRDSVPMSDEHHPRTPSDFILDQARKSDKVELIEIVGSTASSVRKGERAAYKRTTTIRCTQDVDYNRAIALAYSYGFPDELFEYWYEEFGYKEGGYTEIKSQ